MMIKTISPGSRGSLAASRPATAARDLGLAPRCGEENESRKARCHLAFCVLSQLGGLPRPHNPSTLRTRKIATDVE